MTEQDHPDGQILDQLKQDAGHAPDPLRSFRNRAALVGSVYTISYNRAIVAVYDHDRETVGGIPKCMFLLAAKQTDDGAVVLLRVQREARLPTSAASDEIRQKGIESSGNAMPWAQKLDEWVRDQVSLHALECTVLGTFVIDDDDSCRYAEDIHNYYAVNELMVWKPDAATLERIVNHRHRTNDILADHPSNKIGVTRFAAAEPETTTKATFRLNATDMLKRRTVYLGMSRSGKSNGLKIVAEAIYRLRKRHPTHRVGQLIFDLNGEYAQDNPQDGKALHRIHEVLELDRSDEVATYGLFQPEWDATRKVMKMNFFGDPLPPGHNWDVNEATDALHQLMAGREIIKAIMADETSRYTTAFRDADIALSASIASDRGQRVRYARTLLAYQAALAAAGLKLPEWKPSIAGLFSNDLIDAMLDPEGNKTSNHTGDYLQAGKMLKKAKDEKGGQASVSWQQLRIIFTAMNRFVHEKKSAFAHFDDTYTSRSSKTGESWADPRFRAIIRIFESHNGPRSFQVANEQHDPDSKLDFVDDVVRDLQNGKLVIIDQSSGEPKQNQDAAERIMWKIFRSQQERFRKASRSGEPQAKDDIRDHMLVYVEEAHNLLPRANATDTLQTVWARTAKEGSKLNIGMVLATQAPSSIMPEILSETDNWILSYLNSERERKVISGYMDFAEFLDQIGRVSEPGFVRIRTLSQGYTVPVQLEKFRIAGQDANPPPAKA